MIHPQSQGLPIKGRWIGPLLSAGAVGVILLIQLGTLCWLLVQSLRYNSSKTSFRNLRFGFGTVRHHPIRLHGQAVRLSAPPSPGPATPVSRHRLNRHAAPQRGVSDQHSDQHTRGDRALSDPLRDLDRDGGLIGGHDNPIQGITEGLVGNAYSRAFEHQADREALAVLRRFNLTPAPFFSILDKLERQQGKTEVPSFLLTHPSNPERQARAAGS